MVQSVTRIAPAQTPTKSGWDISSLLGTNRPGWTQGFYLFHYFSASNWKVGWDKSFANLIDIRIVPICLSQEIELNTLRFAWDMMVLSKKRNSKLSMQMKNYMRKKVWVYKISYLKKIQTFFRLDFFLCLYKTRGVTVQRWQTTHFNANFK